VGIKLRHIIGRWLLRDLSGDSATQEVYSTKSIGYGNSSSKMSSPICKDDSLSTKNMILRIHPGLGGIAIETSYYDNQVGDSKNTLHVIPDSEDLADALAKIITLESMRCR